MGIESSSSSSVDVKGLSLSCQSACSNMLLLAYLLLADSLEVSTSQKLSCKFRSFTLLLLLLLLLCRLFVHFSAR